MIKDRFCKCSTWNQTFCPKIVLSLHSDLKNLAIVIPTLEKTIQARTMIKPAEIKGKHVNIQEPDI